MQLVKLYRGLLLQTQPINDFSYLAKREITVYITVNKIKASFSEIERELRSIQVPIQMFKVNELYAVARTNAPTTGAIIVMNIDKELKCDREYLKELLRCAFTDISRRKLLTLTTEGPNQSDETFWINQRLYSMFEEAADLLEYNLDDFLAT